MGFQQWQTAQEEQNLQYVPPAQAVPTKLALVHHSRREPQDRYDGYDRMDHPLIYHDQLRDYAQDDRDRPAYYNSMYHDSQLNNARVSYGDLNEAGDYRAIYQNLRRNALQEHNHPSIEKELPFSHSQLRLNPQDHTRHSTASRLEFNQSRPINNPQNHGDQVGEDEETLYREIQRIRDQREEHILQEQNLERIRLAMEAKLRTQAGRAK